jgi:hypothetical protein
VSPTADLDKRRRRSPGARTPCKQPERPSQAARLLNDATSDATHYVHDGSLEAYDLADGHLLWATPQVLPAIPEGEPSAIVQGPGTLDFLRWTGLPTSGEWSSVDLATGAVRNAPSTLVREVSSLQLASDQVFGDAVYEPENATPVVNVLDVVTGARVLQLHVEGAPDEAVRLAFGTLDDGQPVVITYAGGVLRGWLRGRCAAPNRPAGAGGVPLRKPDFRVLHYAAGFIGIVRIQQYSAAPLGKVLEQVPPCPAPFLPATTAPRFGRDAVMPRRAAASTAGATKARTIPPLECAIDGYPPVDAPASVRSGLLFCWARGRGIPPARPIDLPAGAGCPSTSPISGYCTILLDLSVSS